MPKFIVFLISLLAIFAVPVSAANFVPNEIIVKLKNESEKSKIAKLYNLLNVKQITDIQTLEGLQKLTLDKKVSVTSAIALLNKDSSVEYSQPNYIYTIPEKGKVVFASPKPELKDPPAPTNPPVEDPEIAKAWGLDKIGAIAAWEKFIAEKEIIVAVIDTGHDYNHEDLAANIWREKLPNGKIITGWDFINNDGLPFDDHGHGSHTSGTIGAVYKNGIGISGVAPKVSLMGVKFLSASGSGTTENAIKSINFAVEHGAQILSNSWGGGGSVGDKALKSAIEAAGEKGVLFVVAAGNSGQDNDGTQASFPAGFDSPSILAVAATDSADKLTSWSNYGKVSTDIGAPGAGVYSTIPGGYKNMSGTSMACPHAAGAAAYLWSMHPEWDYKKVKQVLMESVDKLPALEGKTVTGGRLNILKALEAK